MKPLALNYQTERTEVNSALPFEYDFASSMNVVDGYNGKIAFIEATQDDLVLHTQSKGERREREEEPYLNADLSTKSRVGREQEDEQFSFLELQTKTLVKRERDD